MATRVAGELYGSIIRQLFEIGRQLHQPSGYPFDLEALKRHLQMAIEGQFPIVSGITPLPFRHDKTKDGWQLLENVSQTVTSVSGLEIVPFMKPGQAFVRGEDMVRRAIQLEASLGQHDAEYLLEHQDEISVEFKRYYLVFPGTVWRGRDGGRFVPCLGSVSGPWDLDFTLLSDSWSPLFGRLVRLRKSR